MISPIKGTLNERTYLMNFSDSNWAILSLIFLSPVSSQKQMPYKRLMIIIGIVFMLLAMIFANTSESPSEGISGASGGASKDLERDLPKEERIPTH